MQKPREADDERSGELGDLTVGLGSILEGLPDAVVAVTPDGQIAFVNALAEELFGYPREELVGAPVDSLWPARERERYTRNMELYFATGHPIRFSSEAWGLRGDGTEFVGEMAWGVVETTAGRLLLAIGRDVSQRRAEEARVQAVAALGERALAGAEPRALAAEAVELLEVTLPLAGAVIKLAGRARLVDDGRLSGPSIVLPLGGGDELVAAPKRKLTDDEMSHLCAVAHTLSIALARLREEDRVRHEAGHDPLTGLANRTLLTEHLQRAVSKSRRDRSETGVLFIDLDDFKQINDAYGHGVGDAVLAAVAPRLRSVVRPHDTVARFGGDEFVVVCEGIDEAAAVALSARLLEALAAPLELGRLSFGLSASVGIALGDCDPELLVEHADTAGYRAKIAGRGGVQVFH